MRPYRSSDPLFLALYDVYHFGSSPESAVKDVGAKYGDLALSVERVADYTEYDFRSEYDIIREMAESELEVERELAFVLKVYADIAHEKYVSDESLLRALEGLDLYMRAPSSSGEGLPANVKRAVRRSRSPRATRADRVIALDMALSAFHFMMAPERVTTGAFRDIFQVLERLAQ